MDPFLGPPQPVDLDARSKAPLGKRTPLLIVLPRFIGQPHGRGVAAGKVRDARRLALVVLEPLRATVGKVRHARTALAPAVVGGVVLGQPPSHVVAVVGHLVIELIRGRVEFEHPLDPPLGLIEHVGRPVRSRPSSRVDAVGKKPIRRVFPALGSGLLMELPGQQHLRGGIAGSQEVFEQVRGIVPASANVDLCTARLRPVGRASVVLMTFGIQPRIIAATLLPHKLQEHVGQGPEDILADAEGKGSALPHNDTEPAGPAERGEVDFGMPREIRPPSPRQEIGLTLANFLTGVGVDHAERAIEFAAAKATAVFGSPGR